MKDLQMIYNQEVLGKEFRMYGTNENPLFLAKDVAEWIEHSHTTRMLENVDEDEKLSGVVFHSGQSREMIFLTEDGLYEVLMQSRKPIAKIFKKQVKGILKSVRQTGGAVVEGREEEFVFKHFPSFSDEVKMGMVRDLMAKNKMLKPQAEKFQNFMDTDGTFGFRELVKHINGLGHSIKETKARDILKDNGIICKQGNKYVISQEGVRQGYGVVKDCIVGKQNVPQTRYTDKTRDLIIESLGK